MVISISNHKGGVGKTTSAVNIGVGLKNEGKKVLLIDLDPQANLTQSLGLQTVGKTIYHAMKGDALPIVTSTVDVVPSSLDLAAIESELASKIARESVLKKLLAPYRDKYDYILIDCPPSLGILTINAFTASDEIFIPLQAEYLALSGLSKMMEIMELIRSELNPSLKVGGIFLTQFDSRKVLNRNILEGVKDQFPNDVFNSIIRENVSLAEAPISQRHIFDYSARSKGAEDYAALVTEIIKKHKKSKRTKVS
jgi:chromosome partitioning protein